MSCGASRRERRSAPARSPMKSMASSTSRCMRVAPEFLTATRRRAATTSGLSRSAELCRRRQPPRRRWSAGRSRVCRSKEASSTTPSCSRAPTTPRRIPSAQQSRPPSPAWRRRTCGFRVGTTVTFTNPATNANTHCATQFFEGLFNFRLAPGESATHTFSESRRILFQRLLQPATDRQGRSPSVAP